MLGYLSEITSQSGSDVRPSVHPFIRSYVHTSVRLHFTKSSSSKVLGRFEPIMSCHVVLHSFFKNFSSEKVDPSGIPFSEGAVGSQTPESVIFIQNVFYSGNEHKNDFTLTTDPIRSKFGMEHEVDGLY